MPAPIVFSTEQLPERNRLAAWIDAIGETIIGLRIDPREPNSFIASVELYDLDPVGVHRLSVRDQIVHRTAQMVSRSAPGPVFVQQVHDRPMRYRQFGHELVVRPGECALIDGRHPYEIEYDGPNSAVGLSLDAEWLATWLPADTAGRPRVFSPGEGWGGVLAASMAGLSGEELSAMSTAQASIFGFHVGSLLALALGGRHDARSANGRDALLDAMRDTLRSGSQDGSLTPDDVADHHGVSVRTLHLAFAEGGTSFGRELLDRRLEAAARMLQDSRFDRLAATEIAIRSGFTNASHFARRFRSRFGVTPSGLRNRRDP